MQLSTAQQPTRVSKPWLQPLVVPPAHLQRRVAMSLPDLSAEELTSFASPASPAGASPAGSRPGPRCRSTGAAAEHGGSEGARGRQRTSVGSATSVPPSDMRGADVVPGRDTRARSGNRTLQRRSSSATGSGSSGSVVEVDEPTETSTSEPRKVGTAQRGVASQRNSERGVKRSRKMTTAALNAEKRRRQNRESASACRARRRRELREAQEEAAALRRANWELQLMLSQQMQRVAECEKTTAALWAAMSHHGAGPGPHAAALAASAARGAAATTGIPHGHGTRGVLQGTAVPPAPRFGSVGGGWAHAAAILSQPQATFAMSTAPVAALAPPRGAGPPVGAASRSWLGNLGGAPAKHSSYMAIPSSLLGQTPK